ncbi:MAG: Flp pilus assembly protein CpaB [Bdellovibrionales bacterium GWA2_49_15]|nr:MAG: Flp pilus assembly protein CpaB [Bdellovibrionales bacterium GWA2_49_15]HAZ11371.1 Flp pilus assembly protein CpaB [Bdellovibrionales bacterium]
MEPKAILTSKLSRLKKTPLWRIESLLIVLAFILSIVSGLLRKGYENQKISYYKDLNKTESIVVWAEDMNRDTLVGKQHLTVKNFLAVNVTPNMIQGSQYERILNRRLLLDVKKGDPFLLTSMADSGKDAIAMKIPLGKRFYTMTINDKMLSQGWVRPNDHVDIVTTMSLPVRGETTFSLLQNVTLVTVGKSTSWSTAKGQTGSEIGFFVTPDEFELLSFAEKKGNFSLSLRNPEDLSTSLETDGLGSDGVDLGKFLDSKIIRSASGGGNFKVTIKDQIDLKASSIQKKENEK